MLLLPVLHTTLASPQAQSRSQLFSQTYYMSPAKTPPVPRSPAQRAKPSLVLQGEGRSLFLVPLSPTHKLSLTEVVLPGGKYESSGSPAHTGAWELMITLKCSLVSLSLSFLICSTGIRAVPIPGGFEKAGTRGIMLQSSSGNWHLDNHPLLGALWPILSARLSGLKVHKV